METARLGLHLPEAKISPAMNITVIDVSHFISKPHNISTAKKSASYDGSDLSYDVKCRDRTSCKFN